MEEKVKIITILFGIDFISKEEGEHKVCGMRGGGLVLKEFPSTYLYDASW